MKTLIVTALFDIKRSDKGDGRTMDDYLSWLGKTLELKCDIAIYTEERFKQFVLDARAGSENETYIITQKLEEIPFYHNNDKMKEIISSEEYLNKMNDTNRVECYLSEYNMIQYSKFGWLKDSVENHGDYDLYYWMDAGCSRFFDGFDVNNKWPNEDNIDCEKITIQGNANYVDRFNSMVPDTYIWDNNCMLVGTLFGGNKENINKLYNLVNETFNYYMDMNCVNNEQFALAILAKQNPDMFDVRVKLNGRHLPLFQMLG